MVTISEIEERIASLHREGKNIKEISKIVHKNYTFIGAILRKQFPEEYPDTNGMNKETQALKLFSKDKTPTQVAIELGSSSDETEKLYTNFWRLESLYELYNMYIEHTRNLREFLHFLNQLRDRKITTRRGFNKVLKIIDYDKAMKESVDIKLNTEIWDNDTPNDDSSIDVLV